MDDETFETPDLHIKLEEAQKRNLDIQVGEFIEEPLESIDFGRIGAQAAKQVIFQKIRDAEREQVLADFMERKEHLVSGTVKRLERGNAIIELRQDRSLVAARPNDRQGKPARRRSHQGTFAARGPQRARPASDLVTNII